MNPQEMEWGEEAHYYHTIQYFNALLRKHGAKTVLEDLKNLDLDSYADLCYTVLQQERLRARQVAVLLKKPDANQD